MTQQHPITPPASELVLQWIGEFFGCTAGGELSDSERFLTARAAQWGGDQELETCCEWLDREGWSGESRQLRAARRPKPPSLKEQALALLDPSNTYGSITREDEYRISVAKAEIIRRALEQLPDNE
jgi:hypothetical protein